MSTPNVNKSSSDETRSKKSPIPSDPDQFKKLMEVEKVDEDKDPKKQKKPSLPEETSAKKPAPSPLELPASSSVVFSKKETKQPQPSIKEALPDLSENVPLLETPTSPLELPPSPPLFTEEKPRKKTTPYDTKKLSSSKKEIPLPSTKKEKSLSEKEQEPSPIAPFTPPQPLSPPIEVAPSVPTGNTAPIAAVERLFGSMVQTIQTMTQSGITETVVLLNAPSFEGSVFFGSKILLQRYATAPDSFNITFMSTQQQAVALFNENVGYLNSAFEKGNFAFKVNRLSAEFSTQEKPLFRRREEGGGKKDQNFNPR